MMHPPRHRCVEGRYPPTGQNPSRSGPARRSRLNREKHLDITFVVDDENKETHVLSPALRTALEISLIASAALWHTTLFSFHGSKRILFYTQTVMQECETLHMAGVINCGIFRASRHFAILPTTEVSSCKGRIIKPLLRRRRASSLGEW